MTEHTTPGLTDGTEKEEKEYKKEKKQAEGICFEKNKANNQNKKKAKTRKAVAVNTSQKTEKNEKVIYEFDLTKFYLEMKSIGMEN